MRAFDPSARLTPEQHRAADAGLKAMIPLNGRPLLDYILSSLADAGIRHVALVVAPMFRAAGLLRGHGPRSHSTRTTSSRNGPWGRLMPCWPRGVAHRGAISRDECRQSLSGAALSELAALPEPALPAFDREDLVRSSNIPAERIRSFAFLDIDASGYLTGIVEKPAGASDRVRRTSA